MQRSKFSVSIKLATLTAALALCGAAYAATGTAASTAAAAPEPSVQVAPAASDTRADHRHKSRDHHQSMRGYTRDAAMWVPGYGPLDAKFVESLALTEKQTKILQEAQTKQKAGQSSRRDAMKAARTAKLEQLKSGKIDPRAALKQAEEVHKQAFAERSQLDEKWLAVWDSLDATQKQKVAVKLNERAEKFAKRAEKHKEHHSAPDSAKISS